jgi:hypothetical protein
VHQATVADGDAHDFGEVLLALGVVRREPADGIAKHRRVEDVDQRGDLRDVQLRGGGVLVFDHPGHRRVRGGFHGADHPPVSRGILELTGQHRDGGTRSEVVGDESGERVRPEQRRVPGNHEYQAALGVRVGP